MVSISISWVNLIVTPHYFFFFCVAALSNATIQMPSYSLAKTLKNIQGHHILIMYLNFSVWLFNPLATFCFCSKCITTTSLLSVSPSYIELPLGQTPNRTFQELSAELYIKQLYYAAPNAHEPPNCSPKWLKYYCCILDDSLICGSTFASCKIALRFIIHKYV